MMRHLLKDIRKQEGHILLPKEDRIETGIAREREMISFIRDSADYIIDTTTLLTRELRQEVEKIFVGTESYGNFIITVLYFWF